MPPARRHPLLPPALSQIGAAGPGTAVPPPAIPQLAPNVRVTLAVAELLKHADALRREKARRSSSKFTTWFPDEGPLRRALYRPHMAFLAAGALHVERIFLAANRIGKTETAAFEVTCHATGLYPDWWEGKRFPGPNHWWVAGDTMETTRNVPQVALLGDYVNVPDKHWTGMLPAELITHSTRKSGSVANCIGSVYIRHTSGELSSVEFKSYDQGRTSFQGTARNIWFDEEPPSPGESSEDIYGEALMRTMTNDGLLMLTYTPLQGLTPFINGYINTSVMWDSSTGEYRPSRQVLFPKGIAKAREEARVEMPGRGTRG